MFDAADTNQDGTVTADEIKALQSKINESRTTLLSIQEGSGATSQTDTSDITDLFGRMDSDGDGSVSSAELSSAKAERAAHRPPHGPPPSAGEDATTTSTTSTSDASDQADTILKLLDTSGDGTISKDEISLFLQSMTSREQAA